MITEWKKCELGDVLTLSRGYDLPSQNRLQGQYPIVSSSGVTGFHNAFQAKAPGVITGRYGTIGEVFYMTTDYWPLNTTLFVKDFKGNDPRFISYLLQCLNIKEMNTAGAVPGINRNHLHRIKVMVPNNIRGQIKIANILSAYDDLIENNLKCIKLLEEMAQITYEEWFVRMRFPGHETTPINPLTGLPEGWKKDVLGKYIKFIKGKKLDNFFSEKGDGLVKIMLLDSLETGVFKYTLPNKHVSTNRGDLVMCMDGARSSYVFYAEEGVVGSTMAKIETKTLPESLLYLFFKSILESLQTNNTGAAIPHANKAFINNIEFTIAAPSVLALWSKKISTINTLVWNLRDQNQGLREARDILLPRLMTGKIDAETYDPTRLLKETI